MRNEFKLVPASMLLDKETVQAINYHCGDSSDDSGQFGSYTDGLLWVGSVKDDEGNEVYGLHISTAEYPEEGATTLVNFDEPQPPALDGEPEVYGWVWTEELKGVEVNDGVSFGPEKPNFVSHIGTTFQYAPLYTQHVVAPLLAEIEEVKAECESRMRVIENVKAERDTLKAKQQTIECRFEVSEDTLKTIRGCLSSAESDIDTLKELLHEADDFMYIMTGHDTQKHLDAKYGRLLWEQFICNLRGRIAAAFNQAAPAAKDGAQ